MTCNHEDLLGLARGELSPEKASAVEAHAESCASCAQELAWLRTERALFRAQPTAPASHVWQGIERRIVIAHEQRSERRRRWLHVGSAVTVVAAAASFLLYLRGVGLPVATTSRPQPGSSTAPEAAETREADAATALDAAEREYRGAIRRMSKAYVQERDNLAPAEAQRVDAQLRELAQVVSAERAVASDDPWARRRVLRAYSAYMRTMQAVVLEGPK